MQELTPQGQDIINDIAARYNLSVNSAVDMLSAVNRGGGTMAQFSCPELGTGQWMRGGMTMVSDMFNHGLKATVNNLCAELSNALANNQMFPPAKSGSGGNNWWPGDLGSPSSSGGQNNVRYAYFPQTRRLAVERDGQVSLFDTQNHQISGVSQQQGGGSSLTFSSQFGTVSTFDLPLISGPSLESDSRPTNFAEPLAPAAPVQEAPMSAQIPAPGGNSDEVFALLEKLGNLHQNGVLTDQEFDAKKAELLGRL